MAFFNLLECIEKFNFIFQTTHYSVINEKISFMIYNESNIFIICTNMEYDKKAIAFFLKTHLYKGTCGAEIKMSDYNSRDVFLCLLITITFVC